jgi:hypothetical protein
LPCPALPFLLPCLALPCIAYLALRLSRLAEAKFRPSHANVLRPGVPLLSANFHSTTYLAEIIPTEPVGVMPA